MKSCKVCGKKVEIADSRDYIAGVLPLKQWVTCDDCKKIKEVKK